MVTVAAVGALTVPALGRAQPPLRPGSRGAIVADWQRALNGWLTASNYGATLGLRSRLGGRLRVDGVFGAATEAATLRFQREGRIAADGVVGLETWVGWIGANVTCCGAGLPSLRVGVWNAEVGWWQVALGRWLRQRRLGDLVVDGAYGAATEQATALFQRTLGLPTSGQADEKTWQAMQRQKPGLQLP